MSVRQAVVEFLGAVTFGTEVGFSVGVAIVFYVFWDEWRAYRVRHAQEATITRARPAAVETP